MTMHVAAWPSGRLLYVTNISAHSWVGLVLDFATKAVEIYDPATSTSGPIHNRLFDKVHGELLPALSLACGVDALPSDHGELRLCIVALVGRIMRKCS